MARIRSIKPELRTSLVVADWPREVRYFWVLLWGFVDDHGRAVDDARLVKADCFPLDDDLGRQQIDEWLNLLATAGPLCRYQVDGRRYLHIPSWSEHQRPSHPTDSRIPRCPLHETPEGLAKSSGTSPEPVVPEQVVRAGSREQGAVRASGAGPTSRTAPERIVLEATDATEPEARAVVAIVEGRNPRSLGGLLRTMARDGDLVALVAEARAAARKADVATQLANIRDGPACEHGSKGGASLHPTSGKPLCPQCRNRAKLSALNESARSA